MKSVILVLALSFLGYTWGAKSFKQVFLFAFIFFMQFKNIMYPKDNLFGLMGPDNISSIFFLFSITFSPWRKVEKRGATYKYYSFLFIWMLLLMFIIPYYIKLKNMYYGIGDDPVKLYQIIRDVGIIFALFYTFRHMNEKAIYDVVFKATLASLFIAGVSALVPSLFDKLGFYYNKSAIELYGRTAGLTSLNSNGAGGFFAFCMGIMFSLLSKYEKKNKNNMIVTIVAFALFGGILGTGSRTGFLSVIVATGLYAVDLIRTKRIKYQNTLLTITVITGMLILYFMAGELTSGRLQEAVETEGGSLQSRRTHWSIYIEEITQYPEYVIFGARGDIDYKYNVHNHYLYLLFHAGMVALILYLLFYYLLYKTYRNIPNHNKHGPILYAIAAIMVAGITGVQLPGPIAFIALALLVYAHEEDVKINNISS